MGEFKCYLDENKNCDECNECILCYKCIFLKEKIEDVEVICQIKGQVDLHNFCFYYTGDVE